MNSFSTNLSKDQQDAIIVAVDRQVQENGLTWIPGEGFAGLDWKRITEVTGVKYGPAWRYATAIFMPDEERIWVSHRISDTEVEFVPEVVLGARIADARRSGQSWGYIACRVGLAEGKIRRLFQEVTQLKSQGLRIGKGGRFFADDERLYTGDDRPGLGSEIKPGSAPEPTLKGKRQLNRKVNAAVKKAASVA